MNLQTRVQINNFAASAGAWKRANEKITVWIVGESGDSSRPLFPYAEQQQWGILQRSANEGPTMRCHVFVARETVRSIECHLYAECFASSDGRQNILHSLLWP